MSCNPNLKFAIFKLYMYSDLTFATVSWPWHLGGVKGKWDGLGLAKSDVGPGAVAATQQGLG